MEWSILIDSRRVMDIPVAVLLGLATIWLLLQEWTGSNDVPVPRGVPLFSVAIVVLIVGIDWFVGRRGILGHPGTFLHTIFKLVLVSLFVSFVASGLTAIRSSRGPAQLVINIAWSASLVVLLLKFMGVW